MNVHFFCFSCRASLVFQKYFLKIVLNCLRNARQSEEQRRKEAENGNKELISAFIDYMKSSQDQMNRMVETTVGLVNSVTIENIENIPSIRSEQQIPNAISLLSTEPPKNKNKTTRKRKIIEVGEEEKQDKTTRQRKVIEVEEEEKQNVQQQLQLQKEKNRFEEKPLMVTKFSYYLWKKKQKKFMAIWNSSKCQSDSLSTKR